MVLIVGLDVDGLPSEVNAELDLTVSAAPTGRARTEHVMVTSSLTVYDVKDRPWRATDEAAAERAIAVP